MIERDDLERRFDRAMADIYTRARTEAGYNATRYLQMLSEHGGLETARRFLHASNATDGFTALWEAKRLDLSVEAYVLRTEFRPLFTEDEIAIARARLREFGYVVTD